MSANSALAVDHVGAFVVGQILGQPGEHIDVLRRHVTSCERCVEHGQCRARTVALTGCLGVTSRAGRVEDRREPVVVDGRVR